MAWPEREPDEPHLRGGCALGCVMATMFMALAGLGAMALLAMVVGVGQSVQAISDSDPPAIADQTDP